MLHGQEDKMISIGKFYATKQQLEENGAVIQFKVVPEGAHTLRSGEYKWVLDGLAHSEKPALETKAA